MALPPLRNTKCLAIFKSTFCPVHHAISFAEGGLNEVSVSAFVFVRVRVVVRSVYDETKRGCNVGSGLDDSRSQAAASND